MKIYFKVYNKHCSVLFEIVSIHFHFQFTDASSQNSLTEPAQTITKRPPGGTDTEAASKVSNF